MLNQNQRKKKLTLQKNTIYKIGWAIFFIIAFAIFMVNNSNVNRYNQSKIFEKMPKTCLISLKNIENYTKIQDKKLILSQPQKNIYELKNWEINMICMVVELEAQNQSYKGKMAVANVIINRYKMSKEKNIYKILTGRNQFSCITSRGNYVRRVKPSGDTIVAVNSVLQGLKVFGNDCVFYCNPKISSSKWMIRNKKFITIIGDHYFYSIYDK